MVCIILRGHRQRDQRHMPKDAEIKTTWQEIEQSEIRTPSPNLSREDLAYLEWVEIRNNDVILQSMVWK